MPWEDGYYSFIQVTIDIRYTVYGTHLVVQYIENLANFHKLPVFAGHVEITLAQENSVHVSNWNKMIRQWTDT